VYTKSARRRCVHNGGRARRWGLQQQRDM